MRILALGDIHNAFSEAKEIVFREKDCDVILICGDITTNGPTSAAERFIVELKKTRRRIFAVAGNMDSPEIELALKKSGCSIDAAGAVIGDTGFFGASAAPVSRLHTPYEIMESEIMKRAETGLKKIGRVRRKVFVTHSPPHDTRLDLITGGFHVGRPRGKRIYREATAGRRCLRPHP
jgi:Icc-related predicted phosphoesterase